VKAFLAILFLVILYLLAPKHETGHQPVTGSSSAALDTMSKTTINAPDTQLSHVPELTVLPDSTSRLINTGNKNPIEVVRFAEGLVGIPYLYGSTDPRKGFDCSGFITYVFSHFEIKVPRASVDFTTVGKTIPIEQSRPGDLILFTGTDSSIRIIGHMGMIVSNENHEVQFIHSSSGRANGVVITPLEKYYQGRFMRIARIFPG
jgi:cell wall-associated NlpC family hydrolase